MDGVDTLIRFDGAYVILDSVPEQQHGLSPLVSSIRTHFMTYLEVVYRYGAVPGEAELKAIDGMREVYGVRRVQFNAKERTVRVEFDASRLKADAVTKLLRQAGVDVQVRLILA